MQTGTATEVLNATGTQHQFGYEWARYPEILDIHHEQWVRWIAPFDERGFAGKRFLDGGCGVGRNAHWAMQAGARGGIAVDFDTRTLEGARRNLARYPDLEVRHQSLYDLDDVESVDIAFSIGVVHHVAEPRRVIENLVRAIKPGGTLILWVYGHEGNERYLAMIDPLRKYVTSRLPHGLTRWVARAMTVPLWFYIRLPHKKSYLLLLRRLSFRSLELIVLDQLIPTIAFYWTREELLALVEGLGLTDIETGFTNGMSWTLVAKKPA